MIALIKRLVRGIDSINNWTGKIASFLIPLLIGFETYEVISRYVFGRPTIWITELSAMIFGALILLGGGYTMYQGSMANMDIVYMKFSERGRAIIDSITFLFFVMFIGVLFCKGGYMAWKSLIDLEHDSTEWAPPLYYFKMTLPVGAFLLLLQGFAKFLKDIIIVIKGEY